MFGGYKTNRFRAISALHCPLIWAGPVQSGGCPLGIACASPSLANSSQDWSQGTQHSSACHYGCTPKRHIFAASPSQRFFLSLSDWFPLERFAFLVIMALSICFRKLRGSFMSRSRRGNMEGQISLGEFSFAHRTRQPLGHSV